MPFFRSFEAGKECDKIKWFGGGGGGFLFGVGKAKIKSSSKKIFPNVNTLFAEFKFSRELITRNAKEFYVHVD